MHLNLANNRIQTLSFVHLPSSVSSLDLTNNLLKDVPSDIGHLVGLEHLEMEGNPLDCSCENLLARDRLLIANVYIDNVKCASPSKSKGKSWLELKLKDICKVPKTENNLMDMMMGDQPIDAVQIGAETTKLKSMPLVAKSDLDDGNVIQGSDPVEDDDQIQFLKVGHNSSPSPYSQIEGSGEGDDAEHTTMIIFMEPKMQKIHDKGLSAENEQTTVDTIEGSGDENEGSGESITFAPIIFDDTPTTPYEELRPDSVHPYFTEEEQSSTEFPLPEPMSPLYTGGPDWNKDPSPEPTTEKAATSPSTRDTTVFEQIRVTQANEVRGQIRAESEELAPHKTGTYVCIAIIVILLVGLIGFAIIKGQMRKRRDRRLLRQQKRDVEKASKEMVDMNKSLLGKPAGVEAPVDKKVNGKYELVPTHETPQKKSENGELSNGVNKTNNNGLRTDSPRDTNQNKSSSRDNNLVDDRPQQHETSFDSEPASPDSRKDTNSLSSEDIFVPINDDDNPKLNGTGDSDISQPLINGDQNTDSDFLSPSREYVPVYSPDMGRVRIKMTETPKPKTPVLVTRSRSNAGDIIITPSDALKPTT